MGRVGGQAKDNNIVFSRKIEEFEGVVGAVAVVKKELFYTLSAYRGAAFKMLNIFK